MRGGGDEQEIGERARRLRYGCRADRLRIAGARSPADDGRESLVNEAARDSCVRHARARFERSSRWQPRRRCYSQQKKKITNDYAFSVSRLRYCTRVTRPIPSP